MELRKKNIHMNKTKGKIVTQVTLDEDYNIPDSKSDVGRIILKQADATLDGVLMVEEKVTVRGRLNFELLYGTDDGQKRLQNVTGSIPFEEIANYPGLESGDHVQVRWETEDVSVSVINTRKLRINAIITLELIAECGYDESAAQDVIGDDSLQTLTKDLDVVSLNVRKKDTFRIKEEMELPGNKPNIDGILWRGMSLRNIDCRPADGKLDISGELLLFVIYAAEEEHVPMQWMEKSIPFAGELDVSGCNPSMIPAIGVELVHKDMEAKPDYDGENRVISIEAVLELNIKLYEEESVRLLSDMYSPVKEIIPQVSEGFFESLLIKNSAKCKVVDKIKIPADAQVLQICNSQGSVKVDRVNPVENGLQVEGALSVTMLYMSPDDAQPMQSLTGVVPFSHVVEAKGIDERCFFELTPSIEQLSTVMLTTEEIEVRASVILDALVLSKITEPIIAAVKEEPLKPEIRENMPSIVGYIVKQGDSLWDVAKRYYTTTDSVKAMNGLTKDSIAPGDRLLLIKEAEKL